VSDTPQSDATTPEEVPVPGIWATDTGEGFAPKRLTGARKVESVGDHPWVVRTPDTTIMPTKDRLRTSWPLLRMYAMRQVQLRYRQSILGLAWTVVQPVAIMAIYGTIFIAFFEVTGGGLPYLSVAWAGLTVWMYVQAAVQMGTVSLQNDAWLLGRVWFPREIIPLAPVLAGLVDLGAAGVILFAILLFQGIGISIHLVVLPLILVVLIVWSAAISVFCAAITIFLRDMATIVSLGLRLMFIATPVMYAESAVPEEYRWVNAINPFAVVVNNVRATLLSHVWPNWELLALHLAIGLVLLAGAMWYLRAVERRMVDVV
jgi:lipopolysaccharide transport system permease protein